MGDYNINLKIQNNFSFDIYCGVSYYDFAGDAAASADLSLYTAGETKMTVTESLNRKGVANAVFVDTDSMLWTCEAINLNTDREDGTFTFEFLQTRAMAPSPGSSLPPNTGNFLYVYDQKGNLNGSAQFAPVCHVSKYTPT